MPNRYKPVQNRYSTNGSGALPSLTGVVQRVPQSQSGTTVTHKPVQYHFIRHTLKYPKNSGNLKFYQNPIYQGLQCEMRVLLVELQILLVGRRGYTNKRPRGRHGSRSLRFCVGLLACVRARAPRRVMRACVRACACVARGSLAIPHLLRENSPLSLADASLRLMPGSM